MRGAIVLAFDDGRPGTMDAFGVLSAAGVAATVPANPNLNGTTAPDGAQIMSWDEFDTITTAGWEATNHSHNHLDLQTLTPAQVEDEVALARQALEARGYPNEGHLHFVVPQHRTSETIRSIVMRYSKSNRDVSGGTTANTVPLTWGGLRGLYSNLYDPQNLAGIQSWLAASVDSGKLAFLHTHGGDAATWGQMANWFESSGYAADCLTMTQLFQRYEWLWNRPQPLSNARPSF